VTLPVWSVGPYTPLTVANIKTEFDGNIPADISDYYRTQDSNGLVSFDRIGYPFGIETPIPVTGNAISVSNFYGASQVPYTITTDKQLYNEGELVTFSITAPERDAAQMYWTIEDTTIELTLTPTQLLTANRGRPYNATITASNGVSPYTYRLSNGSLPPGMTISPEGRISGATTGVGSYLFNIIATDAQSNTGFRNYSLTILVPEITINPFPLASAFQRVPYSQTLSAAGGDGSYVYAVTSGSLPEGLTLNPTNGAITGRPTVTGSFIFKITATDVSTNTGSRDYTLLINPVVITIAPATLENAKQNNLYSQQLSATGGQDPYVWSVVDTIPSGLTLSSTGLISGTPTVTGILTFSVRALDDNGNSATKVYNLRILSDEWTITLDAQGPAPVSIDEGTTLTFRIRSPETLPQNLTAYLAVGNPSTTDSADISRTTDEITITNSIGTAPVQIVADATTEGAEYFDVWVEYPRGTRKKTYGRVNINDTSMTPTFTANISPSIAPRGTPVLLSWAVVNPPVGSYVIVERFNSVVTNDNTQYPTTGTKNFTAPTTGGADGLGGGSWSSLLKLFSSSGTLILSESPNYTVNSATYSIVPDKTTVYEGQTVSYQISTTNVTNGTILYWVTAGTSTASNFTDNTQTGAVTITNNTGTINRGIAADGGVLSSPTSKTILLTLRSGAPTGPLLSTAPTVTISDLQTFTITPDKTTANEGDSITWSIATTSIVNGTSLYWKNIGTTVAGDFNQNVNSGTVAINNQTGSFSLILKNDFTTEGSETAIIELRVVSLTGTVVATAAAVTITDTSLTVNETITGPATTASNVPINVVIANGVPNTTFSYTGAGAAAAANGSGTLDSTGSFTFVNLDFSATGAGVYTYNFTFNATGHTRSYTVTVTALPVVPTFTNGAFETTTPVTQSGTVVQIPGWKIYLESMRLSGFSTILGFPTPTDPTPRPRNSPAPYGDAPSGSATYQYSFDAGAPAGDGSKVLRLRSSGSTASPYGILRGPYVISDSLITASVGDTAEFWWKAEGGNDDYDVFAYLLDESNGKSIILLDANGSTTSWAKVSKTFASGDVGTYRFIFVSGSYDASGGLVLGASLYLDNIKLIKA
jgi:hypothetical protein